MTITVTAKRSEWATRISAAWQQSVANIIETGRLLIEAKATLGHGEWLPMIESDLPFGPRTAQMLIKVADDNRLTNAKHASHLPPSWGTLYELTKLDDNTFEQKLRDGTINPEMQRKDATRQNCIVSRERDRRRVENLAPGTADRVETNNTVTARNASDAETREISDGTEEIELA